MYLLKRDAHLKMVHLLGLLVFEVRTLVALGRV